MLVKEYLGRNIGISPHLIDGAIIIKLCNLFYTGMTIGSAKRPIN